MELTEACEVCHNKVFPYQKYCRKCANLNKRYNPNHYNSYRKRSEPTKYTLELAKALYSMGIGIELEPEIWYTSCNFYTPDILVNSNFIIEVDGQVHEDLQVQKNDRIRQRALENSGYSVYRFKNKEIVHSLAYVIAKIKSIINQSKQKQMEDNSRNIPRTKIIELDVPEDKRLSNVSEGFIKAYAIALNSTLTSITSWTGQYFKEFLSQYNPTPTANRCAMEKLIFVVLGLNLRSKSNRDNNYPNIDFEHYSALFNQCVQIMNYFFGKIGEIELKNAFNITATNFIKNIIFYGKPRIAQNRLVLIKDYKGIVTHINDFNKHFFKFGISVEELEVKVECIGELEKIKRSLEEKSRFDPAIISQKQTKHFRSLNTWLEEAKAFQWLSTWLGYENFG